MLPGRSGRVLVVPATFTPGVAPSRQQLIEDVCCVAGVPYFVPVED